MSATQRLGTGLSAEFAEKNPNTPVSATDIANKAYVDSVAAGLSPKASVLVASVAALPAFTYVNGVSGVGATITQNPAFSALSIDGVTPSVGDRVLIKDETAGNAPYNGIYTVTQVGSGVVPFILTRSTDNDQAADFPGAFVFVESGTVNTGAGFVCTNTPTVVVGTTAIVWTQFSGAGEITVVAPLTKSGNQISISTMVGANGSGGARGVCSAPSAGDAAAGKFWKADATWSVPVSNFVSSRVTTTGPTYNATNANSIILANAVSAAITVNLPAASGNDKLQITIKKIDQSAFVVTVKGSGAELIDISNTFNIDRPMDSITVVCDGTQWWVI
jgi:hypothetical protein